MENKINMYLVADATWILREIENINEKCKDEISMDIWDVSIE